MSQKVQSDSLWLVRHSDTWAGLCVSWWRLGLCDWSVSAGQRSAAADEDWARRQPSSGHSGLVCSTNPEPPECRDVAAAADAGSRRQTRDGVWNTKTEGYHGNQVLVGNVDSSNNQSAGWVYSNWAWVCLNSLGSLLDLIQILIIDYQGSSNRIGILGIICRRQRCPSMKVWCIRWKKKSSGVSDSPDTERPQVREQLWEESDQVRGGAPGLQVQVLQVRSSVWDNLQIFRLQIHTESQTEEGGRQEVCVHCQRVASYWTDRLRSSQCHISEV